MKGPALVVMARAPVPGEVKTRLHTHLSHEQCASLYTALLRDAIALAEAVPGCHRFLSCSPPDAMRLFRDFAPTGMGFIAQRQGDIGQRMLGIMVDIHAIGHSPIVIVGSDIPLLQPSLIEQAIKKLVDHDLCLGPAADGGYYLIGARSPHEPIFKGIRWSTSSVLAATLSRAKSLGLTAALLEVCSDLDTIGDLRALRPKLEMLKCIPRACLPQHTKAWLDNLGDIP